MGVGDGATASAEQPQVETDWSVLTAGELHGASHPTGVGGVPRLDVADRIAPRTIEWEGVGETERRSIAAQGEQGGPQRPGVRLPDEDEVDRIFTATGEVGPRKRPQLE